MATGGVRPTSAGRAARFDAAQNASLAADLFVALVGAVMQDRKKQQLQPEFWPAWESKTSYLPFAAIGTAYGVNS